MRALDESRLRRLMKVWRQAFSVQRVPTTLNAQRSTLNAQRSTLNAQWSCPDFADTLTLWIKESNHGKNENAVSGRISPADRGTGAH
ncbi:MAG: hypothetical protein WCZ18_12395, partial [Ottowia sp.]